MDVNATCTTKVIVYFLTRAKFFSIIEQYWEFNNFLLLRLAKKLSGPENSIALDYVTGKREFKHRSKVYSGGKAMEIHRIILKLKNAIMYYIIRNREQRKVPKLKEIVQTAIETQKKKNEDRRRKKENLSLDLENSNQFMDADQTGQINDFLAKMKNVILENDQHLRTLKQKIIETLL